MSHMQAIYEAQQLELRRRAVSYNNTTRHSKQCEPLLELIDPPVRREAVIADDMPLRPLSPEGVERNLTTQAERNPAGRKQSNLAERKLTESRPRETKPVRSKPTGSKLTGTKPMERRSFAGPSIYGKGGCRCSSRLKDKGCSEQKRLNLTSAPVDDLKTRITHWDLLKKIYASELDDLIKLSFICRKFPSEQPSQPPAQEQENSKRHSSCVASRQVSEAKIFTNVAIDKRPTGPSVERMLPVPACVRKATSTKPR